MKRIISILLLSFVSFSILSAQVTGVNIGNKGKPLIDASITIGDSLTKTQMYNDLKNLYSNDIKGIIKYGFGRADTLAQKGFIALAKGVNHTYDVLKTQQLVKSLHHLFYWILAIILMIVITIKLRDYLKEPKEVLGWSLFILVLLDFGLFFYNGTNFMEMWTGFLNPEYGVYKDIIEVYNNQALK